MQPNTYTKKFKQQAVVKFINRGTKSVEAIADELGTSSKNLYRWRKELGEVSMSNNKSIKEWTPEQKLEAVIKTGSMSEAELGEYLRSNGLHSSDLEDFKSEALSGLKSKGRPKLDPEVTQLRKENKALQRDLKKKDKALAEYSARVILLKKSHEIWGTPEDDE
jgi:transposase-like protein